MSAHTSAARHAVVRLEGHFLVGFGDGTGPRDVKVLPGALAEADTALADDPATLQGYDRVARLIDGFETPYGLELLATTHWVATREQAAGPDEAAGLIRAWSARKHQLFTVGHVTTAWDRLEGEGWLAEAGVPAGV